jgi:LuxR family transcriptional regulator, maltose regulon positive regulatory protein
MAWSYALPPQGRQVLRQALLERLAASHEPLAAIVAPAGYGKSTLLAQLGQRTPRAAYVRLDATHDDPTILLQSLVKSLQRVMPITPAVLKASRSPTIAGHLTGVSRLIGAMADVPEPTLLMLDDVSVVTSRASSDMIAWIVDRLPPPHRLALASRRDDVPGLSRARARGAVLEIGPGDLALDIGETQAVAALEGVTLSGDDAAEVMARTEGWPVATYLALRAGIVPDLPDLPERRIRSTPDGLRVLHAYMRSELLDPLDPDTQRWLLGCGVLPVLSGPICDRALESTGSLGRLRELERTNHLLVPIDGLRTAYQLHRLFREYLRDELEVREPEAVATVASRAARWLEEEGDISNAMPMAHESGDLDLLAGMIMRHTLPMHQRGHLQMVDGWLAWFARPELQERYPGVAIIGAWIHALLGRTERALAWLAAAERSPVEGPMPDGGASKGPWVCGIRAMMLPSGKDAFVADLAEARSGIPATSPYITMVSVLSAVEAVLTGAEDAMVRIQAEARSLRGQGADPGLCVVLGEGAALAMDRGDAAAAASFVTEGLETIARSNLQDYVNGILIEAVAARLAASQGHVSQAREHLAAVSRTRPQIMTSFPWLGVQARLHAIRACLALHEPAAARVLLAEVAEIRDERPDVGVLGEEADRLRSSVEGVREIGDGVWALTNAELRLLAYLPTHLTFREIADRMYLSPHTVKTQTMSIYGKLEVSSRRAALERAVSSGLLDPSVLRFTEGPEGIA